MKYTSFKNTKLQDRLGYLHANTHKNIKAYYEKLYGIYVNQLIEVNKKEWILKG